MDEDVLKKLRNVEMNILNELVRICNKHNLTYVLTAGTLIGAVRHKGFIPWDDDIDIALPRKDFNKLIEICKIELNKEYFLDCPDTNEKYWLPLFKVRKLNTIYEEPFQKNYDKCKGIWVDILPLDNANTTNSIFLKIQAKIVNELRHIISVKNGFSKRRKITNIKRFLRIFYMYPIMLFSTKTLENFQQRIMSINKNDNSKYIVNLASKYGYKKQVFPRNKYFPVSKVNFEGKEYNAPNDVDYVLSTIYGKDYMQIPPKDKQETHCPRRIKFEGEEEIYYGEKI